MHSSTPQNSTFTRRRTIKLSAGALFGSVVFGYGNTSASWDIVTISGREYVSFTSLESFYGFRRQTKEKHVWLSSSHYVLKAKIGSQDILINETKFILSFPILASGSKVLVSKIDLAKLIDPVLRPEFIRTAKPFKTVVIDAGHGGHDSGATSGGVREKDLSLRLAKHFSVKLKERGFQTVMTRETDKFIDLGPRAEIANRVDRLDFHQSPF